MRGLLDNRMRGTKIAIAGVLGAVALLGGCGIRQDMHVQPKYLPLSESEFYADKRASRPIIAGTVARGHERADEAFYTGKVDNKPVTEFPIKVDAQLLERGRERYNVFCSPCHSRIGDGNGMIVQRGLRRPPSFHEQRLVNIAVGHFYDVITNGFGGMGDYSQQVPVRDRWAIAAYIRALQLSQNATRADVPAGVEISSVQPDFSVRTEPPARTSMGTHGDTYGHGGGNPTK